MTDFSTAPPPLIAIDWGTSALRGALLGPEGQVLEERHAAQGILQVPPGGFATVFEQHFGDWARRPGSLTLISGMAGSRQGWLEAPYCACPAGFAQLAQGLAWLPGLPWRVGIVPGVSTEAQQVPDVMRGEEVQIFGALQLAKLHSATLVLPGTHSKWATVQDGQITGFSTWMTGEVYALLSQHSILARSLPPDAVFDELAFERGVQQAQQGPSLLHTAFGTRTLQLMGRMPDDALASYLSGLVIGEELRGQACSAFASDTPLLLIGSPTLTQRYAQALALLGRRSRTWGSEASWAGLWALSRQWPSP